MAGHFIGLCKLPTSFSPCIDTIEVVFAAVQVPTHSTYCIKWLFNGPVCVFGCLYSQYFLELSASAKQSMRKQYLDTQLAFTRKFPTSTSSRRVLMHFTRKSQGIISVENVMENIFWHMIYFLNMRFSSEKRRKLIFGRVELSQKQLPEVEEVGGRFFVGNQGITVSNFLQCNLRWAFFYFRDPNVPEV